MLPGGSQVPGLSAYSGTKVSLYPPKNVRLSSLCRNCQQDIAVEPYTDIFNVIYFIKHVYQAINDT